MGRHPVRPVQGAGGESQHNLRCAFDHVGRSAATVPSSFVDGELHGGERRNPQLDAAARMQPGQLGADRPDLTRHHGTANDLTGLDSSRGEGQFFDVQRGWLAGHDDDATATLPLLRSPPAKLRTAVV